MFPLWPRMEKKTFILLSSSLYQMFTYVDNSLCSGKTCGVSFEKNYRCSSSIPEKA